MTHSDKVINLTIRELARRDGFDFPYSVVLHDFCKGDLWFTRGTDIIYLSPTWVDRLVHQCSNMLEICQTIITKSLELVAYEPPVRDLTFTIVSDGREGSFGFDEGVGRRPITTTLRRKNPPKKKVQLDASGVAPEDIVEWYRSQFS